MPMADVSSTLWSQTRERDATRLIGGTVIAAVFCASDTFCLKSHLTTPSCGERPVPDGAADSSTDDTVGTPGRLPEIRVRMPGASCEPAFCRGGCETAIELYRAKGDFRMIG